MFTLTLKEKNKKARKVQLAKISDFPRHTNNCDLEFHTIHDENNKLMYEFFEESYIEEIDLTNVLPFPNIENLPMFLKFQSV